MPSKDVATLVEVELRLTEKTIAKVLAGEQK